VLCAAWPPNRTLCQAPVAVSPSNRTHWLWCRCTRCTTTPNTFPRQTSSSHTDFPDNCRPRTCRTAADLSPTSVSAPQTIHHQQNVKICHNISTHCDNNTKSAHRSLKNGCNGLTEKKKRKFYFKQHSHARSNMCTDTLNLKLLLYCELSAAIFKLSISKIIKYVTVLKHIYYINTSFRKKNI